MWPHGRIATGAPRYAAIRRVGDVTHLAELVSNLEMTASAVRGGGPARTLLS